MPATARCPREPGCPECARLSALLEQDLPTYSAVVRSSSDRRIILAESPNWNTRRDADVLGRHELASSGWAALGVLCIEERR